MLQQLDLRNHLYVPITVNGRLLAFDAIRGVAALFVFLFHFFGLAMVWHVWNPETIRPFIDVLGPVGTNLLLLICGFWVTQSLLKPGFEYRRFLRDRLFRIYGPYLIVMGLGLAFWQVFPIFAKDKAEIDWNYLLSNLILLPGLFPARPVLTVTWTLSYVVAAYFVLPLLAKIWMRLRLQRMILWVVLIIAPFLLLSFGINFSYRVAYIPLGCLLAEIFNSTPKEQWQRVPIFRTLGAIAILFGLRYGLSLSKESVPLSPVQFLILFFSTGAILTSLIVVLAFRMSACSTRSITLLPFEWLGKRGYSIYLLHGPVTKLVIMAFAAQSGFIGSGPLPAFFALLVSAVLTALAAQLCYTGIELRIARPVLAPASS